MTPVRNRLVAALLLIMLNVQAKGQVQLAEVYRDDNIAIAAAVLQSGNNGLNLGDMLSLTVQVSYDNERVRVTKPDDRFFVSAWPEQEGAYLKDIRSSYETVPGDKPVRDTHTFRFQIMACPAAQPLCRGDRLYTIPEFSLAYELIDREGAVDAGNTASFRPHPEKITVMTSLQPGEQGELQGFHVYFPDGAYPPPLSGVDSRYLSLGGMGGGLLLLLGGVLMSPFNFFKRKAEVTGNKSRWETVLEQLNAGVFTDDARQIDALRRCLVWYCTDKLGVDPFYWVKHEQEVTGQKQKGAGELAPYRELFNDILLSPRGQGKQLLDRLVRLVARDRQSGSRS